jgi:hypothetical protein
MIMDPGGSPADGNQRPGDVGCRLDFDHTGYQ